MSAGQDAESLVCNDMDGLAPQFGTALRAALQECNDAGFDAIAYETHRSDELQRIYYARGRTVIPPHYTVTNVPSAEYGWHFYWLAADIISESQRWDVTDEWREAVNVIMRNHGLACGADWTGFKDMPHVQFGKCRKSPSDEARRLYAQGGCLAVWKAVGAN